MKYSESKISQWILSFSGTEIGVKKFKNISAKQESVSDAAFKAWPFSSNFNFACKDGRVTTAACKY